MQQDPYQPGAPYNPQQGSPAPTGGVHGFSQPQQQYPPQQHSQQQVQAAGGFGAPPVYPQGYAGVPQPGYAQGAPMLPASAYGPFLARFFALLIDGLIVAILMGALWMIGGLIVMPLSAILGDTVGAALGLMTVLVGVPLTIAMPVLYHMFLETSPRQATFGKQALGLRVVRDDGRTLSKWQSVGRCLARYFLSGAFLGLGYFLALFTDRKQALHDLLLSTIVVKG